MNGANSVFTLTGRDAFASPTSGSGDAGTGSSLDASYVNNVADALYRLEHWTQDIVRVEGGSAQAPGLSAAVQRWLVTYAGSDPRGYAFDVLLPLSPAFLEDASVISAQSASPADPKASLVASLSLGTPAFMPYTAPGTTTPVDLSGIGGLSIPPPSWAGLLTHMPFIHVSARLLGATGSECVGIENPKFFDAGSGTSPRLFGTVRFRTPDQRIATLPAAQYEVCLLVLNWIN